MNKLTNSLLKNIWICYVAFMVAAFKVFLGSLVSTVPNILKVQFRPYHSSHYSSVSWKGRVRLFLFLKSETIPTPNFQICGVNSGLKMVQCPRNYLLIWWYHVFLVFIGKCQFAAIQMMLSWFYSSSNYKWCAILISKMILTSSLTSSTNLII